MSEMRGRLLRTVRNLGLLIGVAGTILALIGADSDTPSSLINLVNAGFCLVLVGLALSVLGEIGSRLHRRAP